MNWNDFNNADDQLSFEPIPKGTLVKVQMNIKPGGYDDQSQGWTDGYATLNPESGAIYLNCEFIVLEGEYAKRKIWGLIGLYSGKGATFGNMGRAFIKGILSSAYGVNPKDDSQKAQSMRCISGFADLNGIVFVGLVTTEKDNNGELRNKISKAITPEHKDYVTVMGLNPNISNANTNVSNPRPNWA